jgi:glutathione S-transferase
MAQNSYTINGSLGSPYSLKMRAIMRYRRIPHVWSQVNMINRDKTFSKVKVPVIPIIEYPDGTFHNDSTPMVEDLEIAYKERSIIPDDEVEAFLAWFLEDMGDEWATKMMFHYRWFLPRDQEQMSRWLIFDNSFSSSPGKDAIVNQASFIRDRQVGRMAMVGCTAQNKPLIEETAAEALSLLEAHVTSEPFFFGTRPSIADFSWFGQFSQLATDPTSYDLLREKYLFALRWIQNVDDLGGVEGKWRDPSAELSPLVKGLLKMGGEVYLPFLLANAKALEADEASFSMIARGHTYEQAAFKYQGKCLVDLRARFAGLSTDAKERLEPILKTAKCWVALSQT